MEVIINGSYTGVDLPREKMEMGLTYGIGRPTAVKILNTVGIDIPRV